MKPTKSECRMEANIDPAVKEQYRQYAKRKYGMKLATWLKMLAHRDFTANE